MKNRLFAVENWLSGERESLFCWFVVAFGGGVALWYVLPGVLFWLGLACLATGVIVTGCCIRGRVDLLRRLLIGGGCALLAGCGVIWLKAERVAVPVLARPTVVQFAAKVDRVEQVAAKAQYRLLLRPDAGQQLPQRLRVSIDQEIQQAEQFTPGDYLWLRARLMPPPQAALPGGYNFARRAWFERIGAVGSALGPPLRLTARPEPAFGDITALRLRLAQHIRSRVSGGAGEVAVALATGEQGGISQADAEAMRRSGLTHLLSVSGLHVTAAVAGTMWLALRLLALWPWLALRAPLTLWAAAAGVLTGAGYTVLTGAQLPTLRSLIAASLVMLALALGREAMSMRLVASGALLLLLFWPEALVGPSFQLSFAAMVAIVALHAHPAVKTLLGKREEHIALRAGRNLLGLLLTGLVVECALMPIALFHFHKAGLYGAFANILAIPLTTFVIMPLEALAMLLDAAGWGRPIWWLAEGALRLLLWLAHNVADAPGAVTRFPAMPAWAFTAWIGGGLWLALWRQRQRYYGLVPVGMGMLAAITMPGADILVTNDGRHVATRLADGRYAILRARSGEFIREQLGEAAGSNAALLPLEDQQNARCSPDFCVWEITTVERGRRRIWHIMAARSEYLTPWQPLIASCAQVDIVIADRRLPPGCAPRWLKIDRMALRESGGLAVYLSSRNGPPHVRAARPGQRGKPWDDPPTLQPPRKHEKRSRGPRLSMQRDISVQ